VTDTLKPNRDREGALPRQLTRSILQISISPGGIPKRAIPEALITHEGIRGDRWSHPDIHGGPNQALLLITSEGIDELIAQGFALYPGALGENLTTLGLDRRQFRVGQRYRVGEVLLEITKRRAPCSTLNVYGPAIQRAVFDPQVKAGDAASPRWGLSGFYARVLRGGALRPGDPIALEEQWA
jgi:MOSC domain-containing protein YiiM